MNIRLRALALILSVSLPPAFALDAGAIPLAKRGDWVTPVPLDESRTIDGSLVNYGFYYILNDQQVSVARKEHYRHYAFRVVNNAGVEEASELRLDRDASYERLAVHSITVHRGGASMDYSGKVRWSELQREEALDNRMYDGTKTMLVILEDIREGDVVEYDYTVTGSNPIFGSRYYGFFSHGLDYPMLSLRFRLVIPKGRDVAIRQHVRDLPQATRALPGGDVEYVWEEADSVAVESEDYAPDWYESYPWIEMGEWNDWEAVRTWGIETFAGATGHAAASRTTGGNKTSARLAQTYDRIVAGLGDNPAREAILVAILRFVQDEIRYFGIEIGVNSHKPRTPDEVLDSRFGDCKDKALLFCELARAGGWEAWPALVNSTSGRNVADWLPSPLAFDHAISVVRDADGTTLWFDTTASYQGGTLRTVSVSDYGYSLVLDPDSRGLEKMPGEKAGEIEVSERYASESLESPGTLEVVTAYRGSEADRMRYKLATTGKATLGKDYLEFYQSSFPEAESDGELTSSDDRDANVVETRERYRIPDLWSLDPERAGVRELYVFPYSFSYQLDDFEDLPSKRTAPLRATWPMKVRHRIEIDSPIDLDIDNEAYSSDNPWYALAFSSSLSGRTLTLDYSYEALKETVDAADFADYRKALKGDKDNHAGYWISTADKKSPLDEWKTVPLGTVIVLTLAALAVGYRIGQRKGGGDQR